jgi:PIN domain nuclease of toxin-antitoxin system
MKLLLDTNTFIWASTHPNSLSPRAREALMDTDNDRFVSVASLWEMQVQHALGKLALKGNVDVIGQSWLRPLAATVLAIEMRHVGRLYSLPPVHRDPFDRLVIAQALAEDMAVITADSAFRRYDIQVIW